MIISYGRHSVKTEECTLFKQRGLHARNNWLYGVRVLQVPKLLVTIARNSVCTYMHEFYDSLDNAVSEVL